METNTNNMNGKHNREWENPFDSAAALLRAAVKKAFPGQEYTSKMSAASDAKYGDYQSSDAIALFNLLKEAKTTAMKSPKDVAQHIISCFEPNQLLGKIDAAPNGFINMTLSPQWLIARIAGLLLLDRVPAPPISRKKRIIVDFSSPNIAKEMHVGHLRSTIIGETLCRLLEYAGHEVQRINHIGDWGTQFGMLIAYLKREFPNYLHEPPAIGDLQKFYKAAKCRFDEDAEFKKQAHQEVVRLQSGDEENRLAWQLLCDISMKAFSKIYEALDVRLHTQGESFYNSRIPGAIEELQQKGLVKDSDGAKCVFIPGMACPLMVQKSDGGFTYDSTDTAAVRYRLLEQKADMVIYVVDAGQSDHFQLLFAMAELAGWHEPPKTELTHVAFGVICGNDGKRFKTRSGTVVRLNELLEESVQRAKQVLQAKKRDQELSAADLEHAARTVGYAAVRYADLHQNRLSNYVFSFDRMLDFKGNTAVYLLYAYARISSMLAKAKLAGIDTSAAVLAQQYSSASASGSISFSHPAELLLARQLSHFQEVIARTIEVLGPHELCAYLYDLASAFTAFHRDCHVIGDGAQTSRLMLVAATELVLKKGLNLLGIEPLRKL